MAPSWGHTVSPEAGDNDDLVWESDEPHPFPSIGPEDVPDGNNGSEHANYGEWRQWMQKAFPPGTLSKQNCARRLMTAFQSHPGNLGGFVQRVMDSKASGATSQSERAGPNGGKRSKGRRAARDLLPLPFSPLSAEDVQREESLRSKEATESRQSWVAVMILALDYQYLNRHKRKAAELPLGPPTEAQTKAIIGLGQAADLLYQTSPDEVRTHDWAAELKGKKISYEGDEIACPECLSFAQVIETLPPKGVAGSIPAVDLATGQVREALLHPEDYLKPAGDPSLPLKGSKIWASRSEWKRLVREMLDRDIGTLCPLGQAYRYNDTEVLNGAFGVVKAHDPPVRCDDGMERPRLRLIMNDIPTNSVQLPIFGDIDALPSGGQWHSFILLQYEVLLMSLSDRKCFFYVFALPHSWLTLFMMAEGLKGCDFGLKTQSLYRLAIRVVGMGWLSAVGICQHLHRRMLEYGHSSRPHTLQPMTEIRRDRAHPMTGRTADRSAWQVYLDDLLAVQVLDADEVEAMRGCVSGDMNSARLAYAHFGSPGNAAKDLISGAEGKVLGDRLLGEEGVRLAPSGYQLDFVDLTTWALSRKRCSRKLLQILGGRGCRLGGYRKALMSCYSALWRHISDPRVTSRFRQELPSDVIEDLLLFVGLLPLAYQDMRLELSPVVCTSDASERGGGVTYSTGLTASGRSFLRRSLSATSKWSDNGLLVVGIFDGIGGLRRSLELLGIVPAVYIAIELDPAARRVVSAEWPDTHHIHDVDEVTDAELLSITARYPDLKHGLVAGGFPCQGMSRLNADRQGLEDPRSRLFWSMLHLIDRLEALYPKLDWCKAYENVDSGPVEDLHCVSTTLGVQPYHICGSNVGHCRRPRLYWLIGWDILKTDEVSLLEERPQWQEIRLSCSFPPIEKFLKPGNIWLNEDEVRFFPTSVRFIPRRKPPRQPAGLHLCNAEAKLRWKNSKFAYPPYQFRNCNCILRKSGKIEPPNTEERELMHGFKPGHTAPAVRSSEEKTAAGDEIRRSLMGNTFHCIIVAWLLNHWAVKYELLPEQLSVSTLWERSLEDSENLVPLSPEDHRSLSEEQLMVLHFVRHADHRGSDARICTGQIFKRAGMVGRQSTEPGYWHWKVAVSCPWEHKCHINGLEGRAVLAAFKWRVRKTKHLKQKFLHLIDSQVTMGVMTKRRSSSWMMHSVARKVAALELASGAHPVYGFVRSSKNPSDAPSRWKH